MNREEADDWQERYRAQRALRPHLERTEIPRCNLCSKGLQVFELGERECSVCQEKASNRVVRAEAKRRVQKQEPLVIDW